MREGIEVLRGEREGRLREQSLDLVSHLALLSGCAEDLSPLPEAEVSREIEAPGDGWLAATDAEALGAAAARLGAGR